MNNRKFVTTAVVALFATSAYAACPPSQNLAGVTPATAVESNKGDPRNSLSRRRSEQGVSPNLILRLKSHVSVPQDHVNIPWAEQGVLDIRVAAAKSDERRFESREPPPRHLAAVRSCEELERERSVAG